MEVVIDKDILNSALDHMGKEPIKMVADKDSLTLIEQQTEMVIKKQIPLKMRDKTIVTILQSGSVVVPGRYIREIIKKMPADIHIKVTEDHKITLSSEGIMMRLNGFLAEDNLELPVFKDSFSVNLSAHAIIEMIRHTSFAVSTSESRPSLTGVQFLFQKNRLTLTATNSQRLALKTEQIDSSIEGSFIVSRNALEQLKKIYATTKPEALEISFTENYMVVQIGVTTLYARLIEGTFPDISGLIPNDADTVITLNAKQLLIGIDRALLFADKHRNHTVTLEFNQSSKLKIISAAEVGEIEEAQAIKKFTGAAEFSCAFDGKFLLDALGAINGDDVTLSFGGPMRPLLIQPLDCDNHIHLISPVRTRGSL